jgi:hypothetical protein
MLQDQYHKGISTIDKTLLTAHLMDGFWERWIAHGVSQEDLQKIRSSFLTKKIWMDSWRELAEKKVLEASEFKKISANKEAEYAFRTAGLYYQLMQWIVPERNKEKKSWFNASLDAFSQADVISGIETKYTQFSVEGFECSGRIRMPRNPIGVIVIINPLDSAKEELFTYEMDFVNQNFATVSFDGPGQGQTFIDQGFYGSPYRWKQFIDKLIDYTCSYFPQLQVHLFGTSSGASWAVYGSCNPKVTKTVAVSPAFLNKEIRLPDYFIERTGYVLEKGERHMLPSFEGLSYRNPVFLVHGKQDVMVSSQNIYKLYDQLTNGKCFKEYEKEGHCCNYKLPEIRKLTINWLMKGNDAHDA